GTPMPTPSPQNCEFVSMFWGAGNVTDANISAIQQLKTQGKVKYVLGFNEPDRGDQSNMTVSQALALWPKLESIGLPLGSPAASWPTAQWIYDFLDSAIAEKKRVDFICVHMYVGTDDNSFVQVLQQLYDKYHLPIWITEFATADWNAATMQANAYKASDALGFMQRLLPKLEGLSFVQRYSWFSGSPTSAALWPSALVDANGNLTTLGAWYANYKPNTEIKK
ncbi:MAG: glycosyl hydrolase, partial [Bacteroidota bacterium]